MTGMMHEIILQSIAQRCSAIQINLCTRRVVNAPQNTLLASKLIFQSLSLHLSHELSPKNNLPMNPLLTSLGCVALLAANLFGASSRLITARW